MKVVLVTGGRDYADQEHVWSVLDEIAPDLVIHGGSKTMVPGKVYTGLDLGYIGADYFAGKWCDQWDIPQLKAPYKRARGKQGGPIRNTWMLTFANSLVLLPSVSVLVVAFPGGDGTADTIDKAIRKGLVVRKEMPR